MNGSRKRDLNLQEKELSVFLNRKDIINKNQNKKSQSKKLHFTNDKDNVTDKHEETGELGKNGIVSNIRLAKSSEISPNVQNVVATVNLGVQLDLKRITLRARNAEYNPRRFAAVIMRIRDPKSTALIFSSGKIVATGAKSEEEAKTACKKYTRIIQRLGYGHAKFADFKIQNIVASCDIKFPVRLESLAHAHNQFCSYEPELFPGLIYRMITPRVVLLIFVSGKLVLTGAKQRRDIYQAFNNIYSVLCLFKKN
mmetsp:Transcript_30500/g.47780  ORF Transcript_30500/g.47780 Transcript_30500/m.47780 type:complete len:254 (-) Transcript_30500:726-1487(-)